MYFLLQGLQKNTDYFYKKNLQLFIANNNLVICILSTSWHHAIKIKSIA